MVGLAFLAANHALVVLTGRKHFALVVCGPFLAVFGLAGLVQPRLLTGGEKGEKIPWWKNLVMGTLVLCAFALGFYLWLVIY